LRKRLVSRFESEQSTGSACERIAMASTFESPSRNPPRRSIFDEEADDDGSREDLYTSRQHISNLDSHPPASAPSVSQNIEQMPSPAALQQDDFSSAGMSTASLPPSYTSPIRPVSTTRPSYDSPANDPWSSTPRTNGVFPNPVPTFPRRASTNLLPPATPRAETASYLLDADHISIQKSDEKEGIIGFKHVNYTMNSARRGTQVVRRYSDFAW
jgi:hypothetical protein